MFSIMSHDFTMAVAGRKVQPNVWRTGSSVIQAFRRQNSCVFQQCALYCIITVMLHITVACILQNIVNIFYTDTIPHKHNMYVLIFSLYITMTL